MKRKASKLSKSVSKIETKSASWIPGDDYLLINSIFIVCNLTEVYHTVRFANFYTEKEIENRWRDLLFDSLVSSTSLKAIEKLPAILKAQLDRQIPFSEKEDNLISKITYSEVYPDDVFKRLSPQDLINSPFADLLRSYPNVFYSGRDEIDLYRQWCRFLTCHCISKATRTESKCPSPNFCDSNVPTSQDDMMNTLTKNPLGGNPESFSDTELLLEETVSSAISSGLTKLNEPSIVSRRQRMLSQTSHHGFQASVVQSVLEKMSNQLTDSTNKCALTSLPSAPTVSRSEVKLTDGVAGSNAVQPSGNSSSANKLLQKGYGSNFDFQKRVELHRRRGRLWARLRRRREEAIRWTHLVQTCLPNHRIDMLLDPQPIYPNLAALVGQQMRYLIKDKEVFFGRSSVAYRPHIDLSLEGDASRVSRCHGRIRLVSDGSFWLANLSTHAVYVDGNPVLMDEEIELKEWATICISLLTFRFDVNRSYVNWLNHADLEQNHAAVDLETCSDSATTVLTMPSQAD